MGRGASGLSGGGGRGGANKNPLVNNIVNTLNNANGFVRLTQNDRVQAAVDIAASTNIGDSFVMGDTAPIVKTGANTWKAGNVSLTSSEVLGMMVDAVNIGWKVKFNSK